MKHLFLRNDTGVYHKFNHARGRSNELEDSEQLRHYERQKERLHRSYNQFIIDRTTRHEHRNDVFTHHHWDLLEICFLKHVDTEFASSLERKYGLHAVRYSNFNQDVLFIISDMDRFEQLFVDHLREFWESEGNEIRSEIKTITTISDLNYLSNDVIKNHEDSRYLCENSIIRLITTGRYHTENKSIKAQMLMYLQDNGVLFNEVSEDMIQIDHISENNFDELISNFDIIESVIQGLGKIRIVPDPFNGYRELLDFNLAVSDNLPVIGVLDTGIIAEEPFSQIDVDGVDLTPEQNYHSIHEGHGTTVASLASFGWNYFHAPENTQQIEADAKIYTIKVQNNAEGRLNIAKIKQAIIDANHNFGIRIFNLSMNSRGKNYNSDISPYAYILDKLAYAYDLLIFISTGNLVREDIHAIQEETHDTGTSEAVRSFLRYPNHFYNPKFSGAESHFCACSNLNEPAESMNNITVGALADNLRDGNYTDMSLDKGYPAYYTKKYYIDYNEKINGTKFNQNQKNKHIFKPDIMMPGGDVLSDDAAMCVIGTSWNSTLSYIKNSGTSYAAPLAANLAAKILRKYPTLNMQSVKALLINSADKVHSAYLHDMVLKLKQADVPGEDIDNLDANQKRRLSQKYNEELLNKFISGHGMPNIEKCLSSTSKCVTLVIEDVITFDSHKVMNLNFPAYINRHQGRSALKLTATLCYKFSPVINDSLSYNPLHISFYIGNSMNQDDPIANAREYSVALKSGNGDRMRIKGSPFPWSDDFYPASSKRFSNVQKVEYNFSSTELERINDQISIVMRCTGREFYSLDSFAHPFSLVITLEEFESEELCNESLYDEIQNINNVEVIGEVAAEIEL